MIQISTRMFNLPEADCPGNKHIKIDIYLHIFTIIDTSVILSYIYTVYNYIYTVYMHTYNI